MASAAAEFPSLLKEECTFRVYPKEPGPFLYRELLDFTKRTARPEEFPGLHPGPILPDEPFIILGNIDVDKSRRPAGDLIPCAMCTPNRFLSGKFIYVPRLQCVTIIGHCCADKETLESAEDAFDAKRQRQREEDFLLNAWPVVTNKIFCVDAVRPIATEARRLHRILHRRVAHVQTYIHDLRREGGELSITIHERPRDNDNNDEDERVGPSGFKRKVERIRIERFGTLQGFTVSLANYEPDCELSSIATRLSQLRVPLGHEDIFYYVADLDDECRRKEVRFFRELDRDYSRFKKRLYDFISFFDVENIVAFNRWGTHPENPLSIHARYERPPYGVASATKRLVIGNPQGQASILVSPVLWNPMPNWEYFGFESGL